jgi:hypothetical protein
MGSAKLLQAPSLGGLGAMRILTVLQLNELTYLTKELF